MNPNQITQIMNEYNVTNVQRMIENKLKPYPYYATGHLPITDMDVFPYTRFFRGVYSSDKPIVMEREAGFRPVHNNCYSSHINTRTELDTIVYEYPCSTVLPIYSNGKLSDGNISYNKDCVIQYR